MKSKAPLPLMEQLIMILVFALTAALCLRGFSLASQLSRRQQARQEAVLLAQNAAEILKNTHGDYSLTAEQLEGQWDGHVLKADCPKQLQLQVIPIETGTPFLGSARITILDPQEVLFELTVSWQEVTDHEEP